MTASVDHFNPSPSFHRLELPDWLPGPVADETEALYEGIIQQDRQWEQQPAEARFSPRPSSVKQIEVLGRLASDERMKSVWRELYRRKRQPHNEFLNPVIRVGIMLEARLPTLHDPKNQDLACREFMSSAFWFAVWDSGLPTQSQIDSRLKPFAIMASRLRRDAKDLLPLGLDEFAQELEAMAIVCEKNASQSKPGILYPIVRRVRGDQVLRSYIVRLSRICRELFGKGLPGTVATTAGVVFSRKISGAQVRNMVRAMTRGFSAARVEK